MPARIRPTGPADKNSQQGNLESQGLKSIAQAGAARLLTLPLTIGCGFVSTILITREVGLAAFAGVAVLQSLPLLLPWADFGVGAALTSAIADSEEPTADKRVAAVTRSCVKFTALSALLVTAVGALLASTGALAEVLGIQGADDANLYGFLTILLFAPSILLALGHRRLVGLGLTHHSIYLNAAAPVVALVMIFFATQTQLPALAYALPLPASVSLAAAIAWALSSRRLRPTSPITTMTNNSGLSVIGIAGPMLIISIGLPLAFQLDRIILAHTVSDEELSDYALAAQIYAPLWATIQVISQPLWTQFIKARRVGTHTQLWRRAMLVFNLAGSLAGVGFILAAPAIAKLLGGPTVSLNPVLTYSFGALLLVQAAHVVNGMLLTRPNELRFQAICVVIMTVINAPLSWYLATTAAGNAGPVLASAVSVFLIQLLPAFWLARRVPYRDGRVLEVINRCPGPEIGPERPK